MTSRRSPCFTRWLSCTCSSVIVPLTCGTTPMMSAVTTASSVCGCRTERATTTPPRMRAPMTIPRPMNLPSCRRSGTLAPEQEEPRGEDPQTGEARVDQDRGAEARLDPHRDEHPPRDDRDRHPDDDADQPCREERAQDVDGRREAASGDQEKAAAGKALACLPAIVRDVEIHGRFVL